MCYSSKSNLNLDTEIAFLFGLTINAFSIKSNRSYTIYSLTLLSLQ